MREFLIFWLQSIPIASIPCCRVYLVDLITHCYCFCQIFGMNLLVFPCIYVSFVLLKSSFVELMKRLARYWYLTYLIVRCGARNRQGCCQLLFQTPQAKLSIQFSLDCCLIFLPMLALGYSRINPNRGIEDILF